jgi:glycosyltransferase involved in cell wall biosynthesis
LSIKLLIYGNAPWCPSGYGTQAAILARALRRHGHDAAFAPFHGLQGTALNWEGFTVYPGSGEDDWSLDLLPGHYQHSGADLVLTIMDAWVLDAGRLQGMNLAHWQPVDCTPLGRLDRQFLSATPGRVIAMSRFGQQQITDAGFSAAYAPHALDMQVWSPLTDRDAGREHMGWAGKFVAVVNAANQDPFRKGFGEEFQAFAEFAARHDDALMLVHSRNATRQGADLQALIDDLGMRGRIVLGDQYGVASGLLTESQMVSWHGVPDVLVNCAWGEGFGLAVLQSQACGTPVITTDCSAMTELTGAGWTVEGQRSWNRGHSAWWRIPFVHDILAALEDAYLHAAEKRENAREFALQYDADTVFDQYWAPILAELAAAGSGRRSGSPSGERQVWSPVMFRNETDMLAMRFAETDGLIDRHVLSEATQTHRRVPKPLCWPAAGKRFAKYAARVTYVEASLPDVPEPWVREHAQRDAAWPVIDAEASDDDIVLICDVDEIPSKSLLERARRGELPEVCSVRMRTFIHAVDWEVPQEVLPPTCVVATAGYIRAHGGSLAAIRDRRDQYPVVEDGGWHFSWQGGPEAAREKLETATCHTELLTNGEGDLIADGTRYRTAENGGGLPVVPVDVDETWPAWIREKRCPPEWFRPREMAEVTA